MSDPDSDEKFSVRQYHRDMDKVMKGEYVDLGRLGLPKYSIDSSGVMFLLMIPVMFLWLVFKDPFHGWIRPRKIAMFIAILFTLTMFALMVFVGVQYDLGGRFGLAADSPGFLLMENMGTGGLAGVIFLLWPRTIILVLAVAAVISGISYLLN